MDMSFSMRPENRELLDRVAAMIRDEIMPMEEEYHAEVAKGDR
jgi:acyl-CoA dehydrogenase